MIPSSGKHSGKHSAGDGVSMGVSSSARMLMGVAGVLALWLGTGVACYARYASLSQLDVGEKAERLLELHASSCELARVDVSEGTLDVTCRDGEHVRLVVQLSCSESFACGVLGVDGACWERL